METAGRDPSEVGDDLFAKLGFRVWGSGFGGRSGLRRFRWACTVP